jgi:hypothetical protein
VTGEEETMGKSSEATRIVAVFRDTEAAERAARVAEEAGVDRADITVGAADDEVASLRGEMREEINLSVTAPGNVGPFTKEMTKTMAWGVPVFTVIGALVLLPFGFIPFGDLSLPTRLVIAAVCGAFGGATYGFVAAGGVAHGDEERPGGTSLAAERGVVVGVRAPDPALLDEVGRRLAGADPIRVDLVSDAGAPEGTVATEDPTSRRSAAPDYGPQ